MVLFLKTYIFDPFANLTDAQHSLVMGGKFPITCRLD
jgi:hypothetical protein